MKTLSIDYNTGLQFSFKAYLARWMSVTASLIPSAKIAILELLSASGSGAARLCSGADSTKIGGSTNSTCGTKWFASEWDGTSGLGQQLSALETIQGLLLDISSPPNVNDTGVKIQQANTTNTIILPAATPRPAGASPIDGGGNGNPESGSGSTIAANSWSLTFMLSTFLAIVAAIVLVGES